MKGATLPALQVYFALVACGHAPKRLRLAPAENSSVVGLADKVTIV